METLKTVQALLIIAGVLLMLLAAINVTSKKVNLWQLGIVLIVIAILIVGILLKGPLFALMVLGQGVK
jgi:uncharacterized integral membrane protein